MDLITVLVVISAFFMILAESLKESARNNTHSFTKKVLLNTFAKYIEVFFIGSIVGLILKHYMK